MVDIGSVLEVVIVLALIIALAAPFGSYMARVYSNRPAFGDRVLGPFERALYRLLGVSPRESMGYREYAGALLVFSLAVGVWIFLILWFQTALFPTPQPYGTPFQPLSWDTAIHTTASFLTATDFTHLTQEVSMTSWGMLLALQVAMFLAPAAALSVLAAFVRGFIRRDGTIGNFYVDMIRSLTRIVLPLSLLGAVLLILLSVPATFPPTLWGGPGVGLPGFPGPVAGMESIAYLGSNGGAWTSANAATSLANPSIWTTFLGMGLFLLLPFAAPFLLGNMVRKPGEAWPYLATILIVFITGLAIFLAFQDPSGAGGRAGYRFGFVPDSTFQFASVYSNTGANNVHVTYLGPVSQLSFLFGMFTQATPGSDGAGMGTLLIFALLAVFVGGLMVGRTPEYLGKHISLTSMKWVALILLVHPIGVLIPTAVAYIGGFVPTAAGTFATLPGCTSGTCHGAYGFTAVLYEFTSESANNGSAIGWADVTPFFNIAGAVVILVGRFVPLVAFLKIGAEFARAESLPPGPGTLHTSSITFTLYLTLLLVVLTALLFLPVMALGPLAQLGG